MLKMELIGFEVVGVVYATRWGWVCRAVVTVQNNCMACENSGSDEEGGRGAGCQKAVDPSDGARLERSETVKRPTAWIRMWRADLVAVSPDCGQHSATLRFFQHTRNSLLVQNLVFCDFFLWVLLERNRGKLHIHPPTQMDLLLGR